MQRRQSEALCVFDHHDSCVRDIDPDLDHSGGNQDVDLFPEKPVHDLLFLFLLHPSVQASDSGDAPEAFRQFFTVVGHILLVGEFAFLHQRADDIRLMSFFDLLPDMKQRLRTVLPRDHGILHRKPARRTGVQDRVLQIPVQDHRQSPRDRRGAHDKHVGCQAFGSQQFPLSDAEAVLFVCHHQRETVKDHVLLDQRVGSDHDVCLMIADRLPGRPFFRGLQGSREKQEPRGVLCP